MSVTQSLEGGMVPAKRIAEVLRRGLMEKFGQISGDEHLARKLHKWEHEQEWVEFNAADFALCAVDQQRSWTRELRDIYYAVSMPGLGRETKKRCARVGCSNVIVPSGRGGPPKRYCSKACRSTENSAKKNGGRKRRAYGKRMNGRSSLIMACPKGHDFTPENTYMAKDGWRRCKACVRKSSREYARRKREKAASGAV